MIRTAIGSPSLPLCSLGWTGLPNLYSTNLLQTPKATLVSSLSMKRQASRSRAKGLFCPDFLFNMVSIRFTKACACGALFSEPLGRPLGIIRPLNTYLLRASMVLVLFVLNPFAFVPLSQLQSNFPCSNYMLQGDAVGEGKIAGFHLLCRFHLQFSYFSDGHGFFSRIFLMLRSSPKQAHNARPIIIAMKSLIVILCMRSGDSFDRFGFDGYLVHTHAHFADWTAIISEVPRTYKSTSAPRRAGIKNQFHYPPTVFASNSHSICEIL